MINTATIVTAPDRPCREAAQFNEGAAANPHPSLVSPARLDVLFMILLATLSVRCRSLSLVVQRTRIQERGQPCPRERDLKPGTGGHGCPRSAVLGARVARTCWSADFSPPGAAAARGPGGINSALRRRGSACLLLSWGEGLGQGKRCLGISFSEQDALSINEFEPRNLGCGGVSSIAEKRDTNPRRREAY